MSGPCALESKPRDGDADRAAGDREQQAFSQDEPHHTPSRRAERETDGQLALPRRRPREEQVREVGAGDEEHQPDGAQQDECRRPHVFEQRRRPWRRRQLPVLVLRKRPLFRLLDSPGDGRELGVGLLERRARRETGEHVELADIARDGQRIAAPRNPEVGPDQDQSGRHHANHRRRAAAHANRAVQDGGIAAEAALPEAMADDRCRWTVRTELVRGKAAAQGRRHANHRKQIVEQQRREDTLGHVTAGDVAVAEIERAGAREAARRPDVQVLGGRQRFDVDRFGRQLGERDAHRHQPVRLRIGKRVEDEPVEHAVDQAVPADREPEREDRDRREPRTANELAERVPEVLNERIHLGPLP